MRISPAQAAQVLDQPKEQLGTLSPKELLDAAVLFFTMLRISPSYELARRMSLGALPEAEHAELPPDFDQVLRIYEQFGDVQRVFFAEWWRYRAAEAITAPTEPAVRFLGLIGAGETDPATYQQSVEHHFQSERVEDGFPASLLLSMPIVLGRDKLVAQLHRVLDVWESQAALFAPAGESDAPCSTPLNYGEWMHGLGAKRNATHAKALKSLIVRSLRADLPNWKIQCLLSPHSQRTKDVLLAERNRMVGGLVKSEQRLLENELLRDIRNSKALVENAARGRFPSNAPVSAIEFRWPEIGERLRSILAWEDARPGLARRVTRLSGKRTIPRCLIRRCARDFPGPDALNLS